MKNIVLILSIWAFSLGISLKAQDEKVIVIVNSGVYSELRPEIDRYVNDISADYKIDLFETSGGNAKDLKDFIISQMDGLVGCVFIGSMPVCRFEIENDLAANHPELFPCDLFYMDLDGLWSDEDNDGNYDTHSNGTGDEGPEIFLGRIDASNFSGNQNEILRNYFDRDHNYWIGNFSFRKTGLAYTDIDWKYNIDVNEGMRYLFGNDNYQFINDERVSKKDYHENRLINSQYEFIQVALHSSYNYHWFSNLCGGLLYSDEILNSSLRAIGYNLFACSACDYTQNNFLGGAYIFNNSEKSLVVIGSSKTGAMLQFYAFYQPLGENKPIGRAFKEWFEYIAPYSDYEKSWHYGMTLLGDPLIKFNLGADNHGPIVDIGTSQRIFPNNNYELNSTIKDDGIPAGSQLTYKWEQVGGPGFVTFENSEAPTTSIHLDSLGDYRVKLTVNDGEFTGEDYKNLKVSRIKWEGEASRPDNGITTGLIVRDSICYYTSTRDLVIVNIKNKSNPFLVSILEFEKQTNVYDHCKLDVDSDYAYIASGQKGLYIIDISDPYYPHQVGFYSSSDPNECINDVKVFDNIAYVTDSIRGLVILDIHDRSNPIVLGYCPTDGTAEAVSIEGNYAFIADGSNGIRIIDISDKRIPKEIGRYNNSFEKFRDISLKQNIQVLGNYVYISYEHLTKYCCISIIDVSDKIKPIEVTCLETWYLGFFVEGNYLYYIGTCDNDVFGIFDITNKSNPKLIESYKIEDIYFQGNVCIYESNHFVYLGGQYRGRGLNIFNLNLGNTAPFVYAGDIIKNCQNKIMLKGIVNDDKYPFTTGSSFFWEKISGPGNVYITDPTALNTEVNIYDNGEYIFRLSASDGELTGFDDIRVSYYSAPPEIADLEICENNEVPDFIAIGENIRWYSDSTKTNLLHTGGNFSSNQKEPGIYKFYSTQTISDCESGYATINLVINPLPTVALGKDTTIFRNQSIILGPYNEHYSYLWNNGSNMPHINISGNEMGLGYHSISVTVSDTNTCSNSDTISIKVEKCTVTNTLNIEACKIFISLSGKYIWTESGEYADTIPNTTGCDSIITVNLTIMSVDTSVIQNQSVLRANADEAAYQWIDCGNQNFPLEGETQQSFAAKTSGNYAVIISQNGCIDTSAMHTVNMFYLRTNSFKNNISIYPNPHNGSFTIDLGSVYPSIEIAITELDGRIIQKEQRYYSRIIEMNSSALPGMYMISITSENESVVFKVMKK